MNVGEITIYADGACRGNGSVDNIGAYAYLLRFKNNEKTFVKVVPQTTNNIMELTAVIKALSAIKASATDFPIKVYSDSQYVIKGINEWSKGWVAKNFNGVKNADLWKELLSKIKQFSNIEFIWVKGHSNSDDNNIVDRLCNEAMDDFLMRGIL